LTATESFYLKPTNNKSERGFPCFNPRELLKNPLGEPLTNNENLTKERYNELSKSTVFPQNHTSSAHTKENPN
jgi:hypothetical protein